MAVQTVNTVKETSSNKVRSVRNVINTATIDDTGVVSPYYHIPSGGSATTVYPVTWTLS
tara:strand:- start:509 stop:685 length:177 start_codon:yes stop_codon:yes gene_type:complete